jgi:uncharacterized protein YbcV (DUF1398 family)
MELLDKILALYATSKNYPGLVKGLIALGIESYTVDVATGSILYRLYHGKTILHQIDIEPRNITLKFDRDKTIQAVRDTQQGKTDYPAFMNAIANAGVRFYEATLIGDNKRVNYIGLGGNYEEAIPL